MRSGRASGGGGGDETKNKRETVTDDTEFLSDEPGADDDDNNEVYLEFYRMVLQAEQSLRNATQEAKTSTDVRPRDMFLALRLRSFAERVGWDRLLHTLEAANVSNSNIFPSSSSTSTSTSSSSFSFSSSVPSSTPLFASSSSSFLSSTFGGGGDRSTGSEGFSVNGSESASADLLCLVDDLIAHFSGGWTPSVRQWYTQTVLPTVADNNQNTMGSTFDGDGESAHLHPVYGKHSREAVCFRLLLTANAFRRVANPSGRVDLELRTLPSATVRAELQRHMTLLSALEALPEHRRAARTKALNATDRERQNAEAEAGAKARPATHRVTAPKKEQLIARHATFHVQVEPKPPASAPLSLITPTESSPPVSPRHLAAHQPHRSQALTDYEQEDDDVDEDEDEDEEEDDCGNSDDDADEKEHKTRAKKHTHSAPTITSSSMSSTSSIPRSPPRKEALAPRKEALAPQKHHDPSSLAYERFLLSSTSKSSTSSSSDTGVTTVRVSPFDAPRLLSSSSSSSSPYSSTR
jgi:hypothetical protein